MARVVAIGADVFEDMRTHNDFLVDKTAFISSWWRTRDKVTLICRPRRFGKTLTLSMVERFLSNLYRRDETERLFEGLDVADDAAMMAHMGMVPVIFVSFADVKRTTVDGAKRRIKHILRVAVRRHDYLRASGAIDEDGRRFLGAVSDDMDDEVALTCLSELCRMLHEHWGTKPVVLLDEYDTPLVEAWGYGYWDDMVSFVGGLFNSTFKTNPSLGRALITGITRIAQESIFSDMNNPAVATTTTSLYETDFGFTQSEVDAALAEFGLKEHADEVRQWYDGFTFGHVSGIYNPWSITNFLQFREAEAYWANTSSNALVGQVVREHPASMHELESLIRGETIVADIDERVNFRMLYTSPSAVWSLLLATGYLRVVRVCRVASVADVRARRIRTKRLELALTNSEVEELFQDMVEGWFDEASGGLGRFARALVEGDADVVQERLSLIALRCVSSFDSGTKASHVGGPERFWHGLVLGMATELLDEGYDVRSNMESGLGRLDVVLVPDDPSRRGCVLEFKVAQGQGTDAMERSCADALDQIERRRYDEAILSRGIAASHITHFGIAFHGKQVLVRRG